MENKSAFGFVTCETSHFAIYRERRVGHNTRWTLWDKIHERIVITGQRAACYAWLEGYCAARHPD